jgi:3-isopropylmalate/(R)-2-methylmalate dehydratase large subunit
MGNTMIQHIFAKHSQDKVNVDNIIDVAIDARVARDFGGANVVKNLEENGLGIDDPTKTYFTFDCNPGGCDQKYAANQHICRLFARRNAINVYDIDRGIGTHLAIEEDLVTPGETLVSTDSHANIIGAIGAFGQGMGDRDIAHVWAYGKIWFKVPPTVKIVLKGTPSSSASPKDVVLKLLQTFGANGLLGCAAELYGDYVENLSLDGRITIASMATEMGAIIILFPPNEEVLKFFKNRAQSTLSPVFADDDASYERTVEVDIEGLKPLISRPGHPEDVVEISHIDKIPVDSGFIGSCTNGRMEDLRVAANILRGKTLAPGRVLKLVPATDSIWKQCLKEGLIQVFKDAGVLIGTAGCAGCAAGQIGQTGEGEVEISSGNRNFTGKQGKGELYLASPATVAASLVAGYITTADAIPTAPVPVATNAKPLVAYRETLPSGDAPLKVEGRAWVINRDNIDTDMIFHNRYLSITDLKEMGQYTFDNLKGYEDFAKKAQQGVDCFRSLGISVIIAESFGAIYERNAINSAMPILTAGDISQHVSDGDILSIDFLTGMVKNKTTGKTFQVKPFSTVQREIYKRGGLLKKH